MTTRAVTRSASSAIKKYVTGAEQVYKPIPDKTSSRYTHEQAYYAIKCNPGPQTNSVVTCPPPSSGCKVVPAIHKDTQNLRTQGEHIQNIIIARACYENDPVPVNNTC
jgi:hypothetical protein